MNMRNHTNVYLLIRNLLFGALEIIGKIVQAKHFFGACTRTTTSILGAGQNRFAGPFSRISAHRLGN